MYKYNLLNGVIIFSVLLLDKFSLLKLAIMLVNFMG